MTHLDLKSSGGESRASYELLEISREDNKIRNDHPPDIGGESLPTWTLPPKPLRNVDERAPNCAIDIFLVLLCLAFFFFIMLGRRADGNILGDHEITLLDAARFATTAYPYFFAFVLGRTLNNALKWRLEKGVNVLSFAYLSQSTTLAQTYLAPLSLRSLHWLPMVLCFIWALSPLGSQATLRFLSSQDRNVQLTSPIHYIYPDATYELACGDCVSSLVGANAVFFASLLTPDNVRATGQDPWGNLKVPAIEEINDLPNPDGWVSLGTPNTTSYASMIGIPFSRPSRSLNFSFVLETWYWRVSPINITHYEKDFTGSILEGLTNYSVPGYTSFVGSNHLWQFVISTPDKGNDNDPIPLIFEQSDGNDNPSHITHFETLVIPYPVEMRAECSPSACLASAVRNSTMQSVPNPTSNRPFFQEWFLFDLTTAFPLTHDGTPDSGGFETYLLDPSSFQSSNYSPEVDLSSIEVETLAFRLTQIINTYWMATSFAGDVTGAYRPFAGLSTTTMNTTAIVQTTEKYLHCNKRWLALLSIATIVILCAALLSGILSFLSIGPDVTDYLSALTRAYQVPTLPGGSYLDAEERVKLLKHVNLRVGDSSPDKEIGNIVIGSTRSVRGLEMGRLYR